MSHVRMGIPLSQQCWKQCQRIGAVFIAVLLLGEECFSGKVDSQKASLPVSNKQWYGTFGGNKFHWAGVAVIFSTSHVTVSYLDALTSHREGAV